MKKPTAKQIADEVTKLTAMKPTVRRTSAFGDNHHDSIDAQVLVLSAIESYPDEDAIYDEGDNSEWADNVRDSAIHAWQWANGESEDGAPSKSWKSLVTS